MAKKNQKKKVEVSLVPAPNNMPPSVLAVMIKSLTNIERSVGTMKGKLDTFSKDTLDRLDKINGSQGKQWTEINVNTAFRNRCIGGAKLTCVVVAIAGGLWGLFEFLLYKLS